MEMKWSTFVFIFATLGSKFIAIFFRASLRALFAFEFQIVFEFWIQCQFDAYSAVSNFWIQSNKHPTVSKMAMKILLFTFLFTVACKQKYLHCHFGYSWMLIQLYPKVRYSRISIRLYQKLSNTNSNANIA